MPSYNNINYNAKQIDMSANMLGGQCSECSWVGMMVKLVGEMWLSQYYYNEIMFCKP